MFIGPLGPTLTAPEQGKNVLMKNKWTAVAGRVRDQLKEFFMLKMIEVNNRLAVGPQPSSGDFNELKSSLGFGLVINNRPDGEEPSQQTPTTRRSRLRRRGFVMPANRSCSMRSPRVTSSNFRRRSRSSMGLSSPLQERHAIVDALDLG